MKTYIKIIAVFMAVSVCSCKTMQEPIVFDSNRSNIRNQEISGIKCLISYGKRTHAMEGEKCQGQNGICLEKRYNVLTEDEESFAYVDYNCAESKFYVAIPMFDDITQQTNPLYDNTLFDGNFIVNEATAIWDPEMLDALSISEPVEILRGEYQFIEDDNDMSLKFELPVQPANLESGIVLYLTSADYPDFSFDNYVLDSFYVGYLGESFEPVAVVEVDYSNMRFLLHFPLSLNDNTSTSYFHQIFEDEYFSVPEGTKIDNLEYLQLLGLRASVELMPDDYQVTIDNNEISVVIPFNYYNR